MLTKQLLAGLSAALIVVACGDPTPPAPSAASLVSRSLPQQARASQEWIDEAFDFSAPVYLNCLDETVTWSGTVLYHYHRVIRPDGSIADVGTAALAPGSTLVGLSGNWSAPSVRSRFAYVGDNVHIGERITWTNAATGQRMDVDFTYQLVVAGNGDVKHEAFVGHECAFRM